LLVEPLEPRELLSSAPRLDGLGRELFGSILLEDVSLRTRKTKAPPNGLTARVASGPDASGQVIIAGHTHARAKVTLDVGANGSIEQTTRADAKGRFQFVVTVDFGLTRLRLSATGKGHKPAKETITVNRSDLVPPTITLERLTPGSLSRTEATIIGTVGDVGSGVAALHVKVDGGGNITVPFDSAGNFSFKTSLPTDGTADGSHTAVFEAVDRAGNASAPAVETFVLDTRPPVLTVAPIPQVVNASPTLTGTVADRLDGVATLRAQVDEGPSRVLGVDSSGQFTFAPGPLVDGPHTIELSATDGAGNVATTGVSFTLASQAPAITIQSPGPGLFTRTDPAITGTVAAESGSTVATLEAQVDSSSSVPLAFDSATGAFQFTPELALDGSADGAHTVHFRAVDNVGNSTTVDVSFTLDTTPPAQPHFSLAQADRETATAALATSSSQVTLVGQTDPNITITLVGMGMSTLSTNTGTFQFVGVTLSPGENPLTAQATDQAGNTSQFEAMIERDAMTGGVNQVIFWNQVNLQAIENDASTPEYASRGLAMVSAAVYDAVNSIDGTPGYYVTLKSPADASADAAVASAAYTVLSYLYPAQQSFLNSTLSTDVATITDGQAKTDGMAVGQSVASAIIALRQNDGSTNYVDYTPSSAPGNWVPTAPAFMPAENPQWAALKPFAMTSDSQFRPAGPPDLASQAWADAVNETLSLGEVNSTRRTADETQIALFWNDRPGTYTPPGHWNSIAQAVSQEQDYSLAQDARLFAELNIAEGDAAIVAWDAKYTYNTVRPITVAANADSIGNPLVQPIADWTPLLSTPPFPEYISGHSTFSSAAATVLTAFFGGSYSFTAASMGLPGVPRSYTSFVQAADEAGESRIYGGIHFEFSNQDGLTAGADLGAYVLQTFAITTDKTPPTITINNPSSGSVTIAGNITIAGAVLDNLSGVKTFTMQVDGGPFQPVAFDAVGNFSVPTSFATNGSADGAHTINLEATDVAGNVTPLVTMALVLDTRAPVLSLTSPMPGALTDGESLAGTANGTGSPITTLLYQINGGTTIPVPFNTDGTFSQPLDYSGVVVGSNTLTVTARDSAGNVTQATVDLDMPAPTALTLASATPSDGSIDVGVTQRPRIVFSRPIDPATLTPSDFYLTDTTGAALPTTIIAAGDGSGAWLYPTTALPGGSMITLHVVGASIKARDGTALDAAGSGTPGTSLQASFTTVSTAALPATTLSGIVADPGPDLKPGTTDDVAAGPDGVLMTADDVYLHPIAGAKVYILGLEDQAVTTGADGSFSFSSVPSGDVKLVVDGTTATSAPPGYYFPTMTMDLTIQAGQANTVMGSMSTPAGEGVNPADKGVYLPRLATSILQMVQAGQSAAETIAISPDSGLDLTPDQQKYLSITIPPDETMIGTDGQPMASAQLGISVVPPSLVADMLPPGLLQHTFDITVQAPDVALFTEPVAFSMPNVFNQAPGTTMSLLSFDHTTGRLVIEGTMTVSADGKSVTTDPGVGITHPGWHGGTPGSPTMVCQTDTGGSPDAGSAAVAAGASASAGPVLQPFEMVNGSRDGNLTVASLDITGLRSYFYSSDTAGDVLHFHDSRPKAQYDKDPLFVRITLVAGPASDFIAISTMAILGRDQRVCPDYSFTIGLLALLPNIQQVEQDVFYGAKFQVYAYYKSNPSTNLIQDPKQNTFYVYRFLDAADDNHTDGRVELSPTAPGVTRTLNFTFMTGGSSVTPTLTNDNTDNFGVSVGGFFSSPSFTLHPTDRGDDQESTITIMTPDKETVASDWTIRGDGKKTEVYIDQFSIREQLLSLQNNPAVTLNPEEQEAIGIFVSNIVQETVQHAQSLLSEATNLVTFVGAASSDTIDVSAVSSLAGVAPPQTLGISYYNGGQVAPDFDYAGITKLIDNASMYSTAELNFRLSKLLNQSDSGVVKIAVLPFFSNFAGLPARHQYQSVQEIANALGEDIAHEIGHELGLPHTSNKFISTQANYRDLGLPNDDFDVMSSGADPSGLLHFQSSVTVPTLKIAAGDQWGPNDAKQSLDMLSRYRNIRNGGAFNTLGPDPDENVPPAPPGGQGALTVSGPDGVFTTKANFGTVAVDGPGGAVGSLTLSLTNSGDKNLTLAHLSLEGPGAAAFAISVGPVDGTVLGPGDSQTATVTFDPTIGGLESADLVISSDGVLPVDRFHLTGTGLSAGGELQVVVPNNNVGGQAVGAGTLVAHGLLTLNNIGAGPLTVTDIKVARGVGDYSASGQAAAVTPSSPLVIAAGGSFSFDVGFQPTTIGLRPGTFEIDTDDPLHPAFRQSVIGTGVAPGGPSGTVAHDYVAIETPDVPGGPVFRQRADASGNWNVVLPPQTTFDFVMFDPISGLVGHGMNITAGNGLMTMTGAPVLLPSTAPDTDGDGLPDDVEFAVGTSPTNPDTAGTGLGDFAAVEEGLKPLGAGSFPTGVIASLRLPGGANEVDVEGSASDPKGQTAYVATDTGLAIVNVSQFNAPVLVGQLTLPYPVQDLAVDIASQTAAVVTAPTGAGLPAALDLVDVSNPSQPTLLRAVALPAAADRIVISDGLAYIAAGTDLVSVDIASGDVLQTLDLGRTPLLDVAQDAPYLYAIHQDGELQVVDASGPVLTTRGSISYAGAAGRIFVGGGVAYITNGTQATSGGFATVDVSNPDNPQVLAGPTVGSFQTLPSAAIAVNGSGIALEVGTVGTSPGLVLFNVTDPTNTDAFLTSFNLPGNPSDLAIASGIGYVADGSAGLQVVNFLPFDTQGVPPTVSISSPVADADPNTPGTQVVEGSAIAITATVSDDVQVRNVELIVNGQVVTNDVSFPFSLTANSPLLASGQTSVAIQVRATDTGGNTTLSNVLTYGLVADKTGPTVVAMNPAPGAVLHQTVGSIEVLFDKPIAPASANPSAFTVVGSGPDGTFGTTDDVTFPVSSVRLSPSGRRATLILGSMATSGTIRLTVSAAALHDLAGNALDGEFSGTFPSGNGQPGGDFAAQFTISNIPTLPPGAYRFQSFSNVPSGVSVSGGIYAVGPILAVDLNGDGRPDLVRPVPTFSGDFVSVALAQPGGYSDPVLYPVGDGPARVVAGDLNGDGKPDLIVLDNPGDSFNRSPLEISVLLNNGDGTFQTEKRITPGLNSGAPGDMALGDFNGDGKVDLALTIPGTSSNPKVNDVLAIFAGNGDGTFAAPNLITLDTAGGESHLVAADLNGDGKIDLISGQHVYLSNGDGTFQVMPFAGHDGSIAVGNFEGNGSVDVASAYPVVYNTDVTLYHSAGNGAFQLLSTVTLPIESFTGGAITSAAADFDGDGKTDLVVAGNGVAVLLSSGSQFGSPDILPISQYATVSVATGDANGDGITDILVGSANNTVAVLGNGDGTFQTPLVDPELNPSSTAILSQARAVADLNGDGIPDVVRLFNGSLQVALGRGDGSLGSFTTVEATTFADNVFVADLNGDGIPDLVLFEHGRTNALSVLIGMGNGAFGPEQTISSSRSDIAYAGLADVNGDLKPDIIEATFNGDLIVRLGMGDGTFGSEIVSKIGLGVVSGGLTFGDFNNDGKLDLATGVGGGQPIVALGQGDGTFIKASFSNLSSREPLQIGAPLIAADFNGDGKLDLVGIDENGTSILFYSGVGDGTFQGPMIIPIAGAVGITSITSADLNGDGLVDLVLSEASSVDLLLSDGDGTFQPALRFDAPFLQKALVADLNRDGLLDILAGDTILLRKKP
jgi:hypothetical protein